MVRVIGHNDHLSKLVNKYRNRIIVISALYPPALALAILCPQVIPAVAVGLSLTTVKLVKLCGKFIKYRKGMRGEMEVEKALKALNDSYVLVSYPALKGGASPIPSAFTADDFIWEFRAGSRQPHPDGLIIRRAKLIAEFKSRL